MNYIGLVLSIFMNFGYCLVHIDIVRIWNKIQDNVLILLSLYFYDSENANVYNLCLISGIHKVYAMNGINADI